MAELTKGPIGPEANWKLDYIDKKIKLEVMYDGTQADASFSIYLDAEQMLDALAKIIPGKFDDKIIEMLKAAL